MFRRLCVLALAAAPAVAFAAVSKEMQELGRDVAMLQDAVRQLQQSQDKEFAALSTLMQQAIDAANRANTTAAALQQNFSQQETKVVTPVVGPPAAGTPPAAASAPPGASAGCPPYAKDLYDNAQRDRQGGKLDISLQEFGDYLRCFGSTDLAPNAQYFIGTIHFAQNDYPTALQDFDNVLEKYSDNNKTPAALFYKGEILVKMGRRTDAQKEYRDLIQRFPKDTLAPQACSRIVDLGYHCPTPPAHAPAKKRTASARQ